MSRATAKKIKENNEIEFEETKSITIKKNKSSPEDLSLNFDLSSVDFDLESTPEEQIAATSNHSKDIGFEVDSFELDESFYEMESESDKTMKTIIFNAEDLKKLKGNAQEVVVEAETETEAKAEIDIAEELVFESSFSFDDEAKTELNAESEADAGLEAELETVAEQDLGAEFDTGARLELGTDTGSELEFDGEFKLGNDSGAELEVEASELFVDEVVNEVINEEVIAEDDVTDSNLLVGTFKPDDATCEFRLEELDTSENESFSPMDSAGTESEIIVVNEISHDLAKDKVVEVSFEDETFNEMSFSIDGTSTDEVELKEDIFENKKENQEFQYSTPKQDEVKKEVEVAVASEHDIHSTIRALREDREAVLEERASLKALLREYEQDILTLRANLEESRIEVVILRKRYNSEIEDYNYRLTLAEDKMHRAQEMAKAAQEKSQRLEQKIRIDYSQVKHREKELESKLELLTMDVDAQINTRDQKILELRRKIDSLEFNMENASDRELRSNEEKIRLEDRLHKMMKTLKHSIKHLEDEIDEVVEENQSHKDKN